MGTVEEALQDSVFRVDGDGDQLGTAFRIDEEAFLTADHVVEGAEDATLTLWFAKGVSVKARIAARRPGSDIAVLAPEGDIPQRASEVRGPAEPPSIRDEVAWCGFARLIGEEKMDRRRFGWGRVASTTYTVGGGVFFEVDGGFNPGHSGGPIVDSDSGELLGVVSATAGGFDQLAKIWRGRTQKIRTLQQLSARLNQGGGFMTRWKHDLPEEGLRQAEAFRGLGLDPQVESNEDGTIQVSLQRSQIPVAIADALGDLALLQMGTIEKTFQMGVGIATTGEPLEELIDAVNHG